MNVLLSILVLFFYWFLFFLLNLFLFLGSLILIPYQSDDQQADKSSDKCNLNVLEVVSSVRRLRMFCEVLPCFCQRGIRKFPFHLVFDLAYVNKIEHFHHLNWDRLKVGLVKICGSDLAEYY